MFGIPDPLADILSNKLEKELAKTLLSATYSATISALWSGGKSKVSSWLGLRSAEQDAATSMYLSLQPMVARGDLVLTVPRDMLLPDNLARFGSEAKT